MRTILKAQEPSELTIWKRDHPNGRYENLSTLERQIIRQACLQEQYYLCAYCCQQVDGKTSHNEHVEAQRSAPKRTLDYYNIVTSCNKNGQCGKAHGSEDLPLTPLRPECETELKFYLSGRVEGLSDRARQTIRVLNLGDKNKALLEARKQMVAALIYQHGETPEELSLLDEELLVILAKEITLECHGKMSPFAPILKNILNHLIRP